MDLKKLLERIDLTEKESLKAAEEMIKGESPYQIAAFLALLHAKGETAEEIYGIVQAMRKVMIPFKVEGPTLDIVGTGGDGANTVNISTASALLAAALGVKVTKHGNRASSSQCGSADFLEYLGFDFDQPTRGNFTFLFAPRYHTAFKTIAPIRKGLGIRTVFNLIGPLLNPANPDHLLFGVGDPSLLEVMAEVLLKMKTPHSLVFHGQGIDELSTLGPCEVIDIQEDQVKRWVLNPEDYGLKTCKLADLQGGEAKVNAALLKKAMTTGDGPIADTLALNGAMALYLFNKTPLEKGIFLAQAVLKEGSAWIF
jgi:anthranilate phosphoribosyltransferase